MPFELNRRDFCLGLTPACLAGHSVWLTRPRRSAYRIELIELYVRMTPPGRLAVAIGRNQGNKPMPEPNPIAHVRMVVSDSIGDEAYGCSGDRMSVRWLDKRPGRSKGRKLTDLVRLIELARQVYLDEPEFDNPFQKWLGCYRKVHQAGREAGQEDLTSGFASSLLERAMLDAVCRLANQPIFNMVKQNRLGFSPGAVVPELDGFSLQNHLPDQPRTRIAVRHTVGKVDPLTVKEIPAGDRLRDGLPQALEEYVAINGQSMFKLKASGDVLFDLARMRAIWQVLPKHPSTLITIDANEAYPDLAELGKFVEGLSRQSPDFFRHLAYIEQPLPRALTFDPATSDQVRRLNAMKPLIIDEADGTLTSFQQAREIGYTGCSHKNCKGFYKSLLNLSLVKHYGSRGEQLILSGEDLQNMPIVPLHQDYATVSLLGLSHCERNGHHFNYGLCMVSDRERQLAEKYHGDMYRKRDGELFLDVQGGTVNVASLQCPGFGIRFEPDWQTMQPMPKWLDDYTGQ